MKFKIDENLPVEFADMLAAAGHEASTTAAQGLKGAKDPPLMAVCQQEARVLVTLDVGFADVRAYPPGEHSGVIVLRVHHQDKPHLLGVFQNVIPMLACQPLAGRLWIAEEARVRVRGGD